MTSDERPSLAGWRRIVAGLDACAEAGLAAALAEVELRCAGWPDALRLAPGRWLRDRFEGRAQPRLRVVRAIDITLHGEVPGDRLAWADAPELTQVRVLRVYDDRLDDAGLFRWLDSRGPRGLTELALGGGITDAGARALAGEDRLAGLRSLALFRNAIGPAGLAAIVASRHLGGLRRLLLGRNMFGEPGARALAGETALAGLALLDLDCDRLDGAAIRALADAPLLAGVRALNLSNNAIGAEGCAALAESRRLGGLRTLFLHGCRLDDAAVRPLLGAPWLGGVDELALSDNALSMATVERLAARGDLGVQELDLCCNAFVEAEAGPVLRGARQFASLRRLCL